jgi:hypothetical protein
MTTAMMMRHTATASRSGCATQMPSQWKGCCASMSYRTCLEWPGTSLTWSLSMIISRKRARSMPLAMSSSYTLTSSSTIGLSQLLQQTS